MELPNPSPMPGTAAAAGIGAFLLAVILAASSPLLGLDAESESPEDAAPPCTAAAEEPVARSGVEPPEGAPPEAATDSPGGREFTYTLFAVGYGFESVHRVPYDELLAHPQLGTFARAVSPRMLFRSGGERSGGTLDILDYSLTSHGSSSSYDIEGECVFRSLPPAAGEEPIIQRIAELVTASSEAGCYATSRRLGGRRYLVFRQGDEAVVVVNASVPLINEVFVPIDDLDDEPSSLCEDLKQLFRDARDCFRDHPYVPRPSPYDYIIWEDEDEEEAR